MNPDSIVTRHAQLEASLGEASAGENYQFEREGYFTRDVKDPSALVFNRSVGLRDTWAKIEQQS